MIYIQQTQLGRLQELVEPGKVVIVYGARRVGKTTLVEHFASERSEDVLLVNGDDISVRQYLESESIEKLKAFVGKHEVLIIDEAQHIRNIGLNLKLLVDHMPDLRIIATGSSSFSLSRETGVPLTGRKYTIRIFPLAQMELAHVEELHQTRARLERRMIYGSYPEVATVNDNHRNEMYLRELISSYLFKNILEINGIRKSDKLVRILQLLAFQIGKDVSITEIGTQLGMSKNTVERYLDLLEQVFVIYHRSGFSRNLRKEISKSKRYYFFDNGVRNAVINNFNLLELRDDIGALWENYVLSERVKYLEYSSISTDSYFWRTYDRKEIDLVEERGGQITGYEIKWKERKASRASRAWKKGYPGTDFHVITGENYLDYIMPGGRDWEENE